MNEFWGRYSENLSLADLHIHTTSSDGLAPPEYMVDLAHTIGLSAIAITDHEVIHGALQAKDYCLKHNIPLEVIIGSEISTKNGHLIGLYLQEEIHSGESVEWTIEQIHKQNGLVIAPHPLYAFTRSLMKNKVLSIINNQDSGIYFDGFEIFNGGVFDIRRSNANHNARDLYLDYQNQLGAAIGGTDSHYTTVGRVVTGYERNLRQDIEEKRTSVFYRDEKESLTIFTLAQQSFASMVIEPSRKFNRFMKRREKALALKKDS
ncbi:MAG: PHP domain-containing protein [Microgenomates group bacterium]|jgi:hypothetical protein